MKKTIKIIGCMIVLGMIAVSTVACSGKSVASNSVSTSEANYTVAKPALKAPVEGIDGVIDSLDGKNKAASENTSKEIIVESAKEIALVREGNNSETLNKAVSDTVNVQLPVKNIYQNPDLPQGCEVTSLAIAMNYKGYYVNKCTLSDNYLPKWPDLSGNPEYYYLKEPRSDGWYCFAGAICSTIDNYTADSGAAVSYRNLTGSGVEALYTELENENPVIVWGTLKWQNPQMSGGLYTNLHCMVLSGYTDTAVTITDPIYGVTIVNRSIFESVWRKMGSRALVIM